MTSGATFPSVASTGPREDGQARPLPLRLLASPDKTSRLQAQKPKPNRLEEAEVMAGC